MKNKPKNSNKARDDNSNFRREPKIIKCHAETLLLKTIKLQPMQLFEFKFKNLKKKSFRMLSIFTKLSL